MIVGRLKHVRETSVSAWRTPEVQATALSLRERVFRLLEKRPATGAEIDRELGTFHAHKRTSELKRDGLIVELDKRTCAVSGQRTYEWGVVEGVDYTASRIHKEETKTENHKEGFAQFVEMYRFAAKHGFQPAPELIAFGAKLRKEYT